MKPFLPYQCKGEGVLEKKKRGYNKLSVIISYMEQRIDHIAAEVGLVPHRFGKQFKEFFFLQWYPSQVNRNE